MREDCESVLLGRHSSSERKVTELCVVFFILFTHLFPILSHGELADFVLRPDGLPDVSRQHCDA